MTVRPGTAGSARLDELSAPDAGGSNMVLVETLALGICGTDVEIVNGEYGTAPPGRDRLILGHESLGRVVHAPTGSALDPGDLVVGIVRRPDLVPCANCAAGEWDMCTNGRYTEHGIKELDGFGAERWVIEPEFAVRVDATLGIAAVLLEPASVLAKAWEHVERIGARARWQPRSVLVTGAGPIGLLAALFGIQRGLEVHLFDRATTGIKPDLAHQLGAHWHSGEGALDGIGIAPDIVIECTGASAVVFDVVGRTARNGIVCLTGLSSGGRRLTVDIGMLNRTMVLENDVVFGTVNANRRHYESAARVLAAADRQWLERLVTRRVPLEKWREALVKGQDDVKVVLDFAH
ncbi:MAG: glucose 1-dehydrogenase [Gemmatimonadaceae bacterium]